MRISDWSSDVCSSDLTAVAESRHQRVECRRDAIWTPAGLDRFSPKAESGNGRDDEIVADLIGCRVAWRAKRINEVQKLNLRPRPSMKKEQRPAATGFCANVEKMDLYAVDRREKIGRAPLRGKGGRYV